MKSHKQTPITKEHIRTYSNVTLCVGGSKGKFVLQKSCSTQHIPPGVLQVLWCATTFHRNAHNYAKTANGMLKEPIHTLHISRYLFTERKIIQ